MEYIKIPVSQMKVDYREVVRHCKDGQAVIITRYGKKTFMLMTCADYGKLIGKL